MSYTNSVNLEHLSSVNVLGTRYCYRLFYIDSVFFLNIICNMSGIQIIQAELI